MESASFGLRGVGKQIAKYLARLDINSVQDLLLHLPLRYQDRTKVLPMRGLVIGHEAVVEGVIKSITQPTQGKTKLLVELQDQIGRIFLRFFHTMSYTKDTLKVGVTLRCYSDIRFGPRGLEMVHPEFRVVQPGHSLPIENHLTPVYSIGEGLTQNTLRKLTNNALELLGTVHFQELIPKPILQQQSWPTLAEAIHFVHRPPPDTAISALLNHATPAQQRLVFEELLAHRISLLHVKKMFKARQGVSLTDATLTDKFLTQLSFQLTTAQQRVAEEVKQDLAKTEPMLRLVQGDVGSGKTVIAAIAMLQAVASGYQAALMAPTELLAEQHYKNFQQWLEPLNIRLVFLSGNVKGKARKEVLDAMKKGEAPIIIGTHALFQKEVEFAKLALVVIDEQHRFGVEQRALFHEKGQHSQWYPHQLVMTATPIPRTLAMSFYADLDCSVIDELPPGRTPIVTSVIANSRRDEVIARIRQACKEGKQVYWVCPLIEESEESNAQAVTTTVEELRAAMPDAKIALVHGRMKANDKEQTMQAFKRGETDLLVATTVIEVGVDVPNASLMIIENAERLGLSQLHQLRGRVGRGKVASHCVLLYQHPLTEVAQKRLCVMRETTDGFQIAQKDLELRGPGEVLGTRQTGEMLFHVADLLRDHALLPKIQEVADIILQQYPDVANLLIQRWLGKAYHFGKI